MVVVSLRLTIGFREAVQDAGGKAGAQSLQQSKRLLSYKEMRFTGWSIFIASKVDSLFEADD
jgi:hypothetical protein